MRLLRTPLALLTAGGLATALTAAPQPLGTLWSNGKVSIEVIPCTPHSLYERSCRGIAVRHDGKLERVGEGYTAVDLVWRNAGSADGPDAVVRGNSGGSAGASDIFAVDLSRRLSIRKLWMNRGDEARAAESPGPLRIALPFVVSYFAGASHAQDTVLLVPFQWANGDFQLDVAALTSRAFSPDELRFRELVIGEELRHRARDISPATTLYDSKQGVSVPGGLPVTVYTLLDLMLTGHAGDARAMLHRAWP